MEKSSAGQNEPIFRSTHEALTFAFRFSGQQYAASPMSKMLKKPGIGSGRGLSGLDGAAQAGMVLGEVGRINKIGRAIIAARFGERVTRCTACNGVGRNKEWFGAITLLADESAKAISGVTHHRERRDLLAKIFGEKQTLEEIADRYSLDRKTVGRHRRLIDDWARAMESQAIRSLDERLRDCGMVGGRD